MRRHYLIILLSAVLMHPILISAQDTRPVRDNVGFCWTAAETESLIKYLESSKEMPTDTQHALIAGISPHDDYLYAGRVYYPLFSQIKTREVIIFGVTHGTVRREISDPRGVLILDDYSTWTGPYGKIAISPLREYMLKNIAPDQIQVNRKAETLEHSIEAMLPFLQYYNRDVKITPLMVTAMSSGRMDTVSSAVSAVIAEYIKKNNLTPGKDIFFLISSDANHYGVDFSNVPWGENAEAHQKGTEIDKSISERYFSGKIDRDKINKLTDELWTNLPDGKAALSWCGRFSIPFGLLTTQKTILAATGKTMAGCLLKYSDTWTEGVLPVKNTTLGLTAPFSLKHWVGFLSAGFYME